MILIQELRPKKLQLKRERKRAKNQIIELYLSRAVEALKLDRLPENSPERQAHKRKIRKIESGLRFWRKSLERVERQLQELRSKGK